MKHKVGDRIKLKSIDWYNKNKNSEGEVDSAPCLVRSMVEYLGNEAIITKITYDSYSLDIDNGYWCWDDDLIEELVPKDIIPINSQVEHIDKTTNSKYPHDKIYLYVGNCRMKNPTTREWVDAAIYKHNDEVFVRELVDFNNNFKVVNNE